MYPAWEAVIFSLVLLIWLVILTVLFWRERSFLRQLFPKNDSRDIRNKFIEVLEAISDFDRRSQTLNKNFRELAKEGLNHTQKIKLSRYNPYSDTGGDQSFSIVLLNGKDNGFILTSLHSRSSTRVYIKPVKSGSSDLELSKEERELLKSVIVEVVDNK